MEHQYNHKGNETLWSRFVHTGLTKYKKYIIGFGIIPLLALGWDIYWNLQLKNTPPVIQAVQANGTVNPENISQKKLKFSWRIYDPDHKSSQKKARIQVGTTEDATDMWDYQFLGTWDNVDYNQDGNAAQLQPGHLYYWRVRAWDNKGDSSSSWGRGTFRLLPSKVVHTADASSHRPVVRETASVPPPALQVAGVTFSSPLTPLLQPDVMKHVQTKVKNTIAASLQKHHGRLAHVEIFFKEKMNRRPQQLKPGSVYVYQIGAFIRADNDKQMTTSFYDKKSSTAAAALTSLSETFCRHIEKEIDDWF